MIDFSYEKQSPIIPRINEATDTVPCLIPPIEAFEGRLAGTSLKVIESLQHLGWKRGDTLIYPV